MKKSKSQLDIFDRPIVEIRAVQVYDNATKRNLSWGLEFRFSGSEQWNPVQIHSFGVDTKEENDESGTGS